VGRAVHEIVGPAAEVHEVAALAELAWQAFEMDAYVMSCAVMFAQPLLAPDSGFDWHSALTAGISLSVKLLTEECVFAIDSTAFTSDSYSHEYLLGLEARAFAVWLPKLANVHALGFRFRTSLLDLALEANTSACAPTLKEVTILIVEGDGALHAEIVAVAQAVAPNATILCAGSYVAARDQTLAREAAGSPVHLVLAGACVDEGLPLSAAVRIRAVKHFMRAVDPRKGVFHNDMRERPLVAAVSGHAQSKGLRAHLFKVGVDAALPGGRVTAAALLTLLDFVCERHLGECISTEPLVSKPLPTRIGIPSEPPVEEPLAVAAAPAALEPALVWVKGTPVPTPIAPRFTIADKITRPHSRKTSDQLHLATISDGGEVAPPINLANAVHAPLPMFLKCWQGRSATPPGLGSLRKSGNDPSGINRPAFPPRAASFSSAIFSQMAQPKPAGGPGQGTPSRICATDNLQWTVQPAVAPGQFAQHGLPPILPPKAICVVLPAVGPEKISRQRSDSPKTVFTLSSLSNLAGAGLTRGLSRPRPRALF